MYLSSLKSKGVSGFIFILSPKLGRTLDFLVLWINGIPGEVSHLLRVLHSLSSGGQGSESFSWQACVLISALPPCGCVRVPLCVLLPLCCCAAASQEPSAGACLPQANWNLDHSVLHGGALLPLPLGSHTKPLAVFGCHTSVPSGTVPSLPLSCSLSLYFPLTRPRKLAVPGSFPGFHPVSLGKAWWVSLLGYCALY